MSSNKKRIVIIGGGVIGLCSAFYISNKGGENVEIIILEKHKIACSASGKAGGFLASSWCEHNAALNVLSRTSYQLHSELAELLNGKENYEYRTLDSYSALLDLSISPEDPKIYSLPKNTPIKESKRNWLNGCGIEIDNPKQFEEIGNESNTSQVEPYLFCKHLAKQLEKNQNTTIRENADVTGLIFNDNNEIESIQIDENEIISRVDKVLLALGPWTPKVYEWIFDKSGKTFSKSLKKQFIPEKFYSIIIEPKYSDDEEKVPAMAIFTKNNSKVLKLSEPEIYPRSSGKVYICGCEEVIPIPDHPKDVLPTIDEHCKTLAGIGASVSTLLRVEEYYTDNATAKIHTKQACYLPNTKRGVPLLGPIPGCSGVYLAAGHGCWGILNAPASGKIMSEYILDDKVTTMNVDEFHPNRL